MDDEEKRRLGFIFLFRSFKEWRWFKDIKVRSVFELCLLNANVKDKEWMGIIVPKGSFVTSLEHLSYENGTTVQETRTALKKLVSTGEISVKSTNKFTQITVNNWSKFQSHPSKLTNKQQTTNNQSTIKQQTTNNQSTINQQTTNNQSTTTKQVNKLISKQVNKNIGAGAPSSGDILPPSPSPLLEDREIYIEKQEAQEMEKKAQPKLPEGTTEEQATSFYGLLDAIMAGDYKEPEKEDTEQEEEDDE